MRLKDTFIIICQTFIEACILVYCARSFSICVNKYVSVCHPSDRDINWGPAVQEETFPMQVKEHDNNLHDYS